jgi:hypothetical protein
MDGSSVPCCRTSKRLVSRCFFFCVFSFSDPSFDGPVPFLFPPVLLSLFCVIHRFLPYFLSTQQERLPRAWAFPLVLRRFSSVKFEHLSNAISCNRLKYEWKCKHKQTRSQASHTARAGVLESCASEQDVTQLSG